MGKQAESNLSRRALIKLIGLAGAMGLRFPEGLAASTTRAPQSGGFSAPLFELVDSMTSKKLGGRLKRLRFDNNPDATLDAAGLSMDAWQGFVSMDPQKVLPLAGKEMKDLGATEAEIDDWKTQVLEFWKAGWPCGDPYNELKWCRRHQGSACPSPTALPVGDIDDLGRVDTSRYGNAQPQLKSAQYVQASGVLDVIGEGFLNGATVELVPTPPTPTPAPEPVCGQAPGSGWLVFPGLKPVGTFRCSRITIPADVPKGDYVVYVINYHAFPTGDACFRIPTAVPLQFT